MKLRCPYCHETFAPTSDSRCPHCGKIMLIPARLKLSPEELKAATEEKIDARRRRRYAVKKVASETVSGWLSFTRSPRYLGILVIVFVLLGVLLSTQAGRRNTGSGRRMTIAEWLTGSAGGGEVTSPLRRVNENLGALRTALELFHKDCGRYPSTRESLAALIRMPRSAAGGWQGPYIKALWSDPWKNPYRYELTSGMIRLSSNGPDGLTDSGDDVFAPPPDMSLVNKLRPPETTNKPAL